MLVDAPLSMVLVQSALLIGLALSAHVYAVRHISTHDVPAFLQHRIDVSVQLRPLAVAAAVVLAFAGLLLAVAN